MHKKAHPSTLSTVRSGGRWIFACAAAVYSVFAVDLATRPIVWLLGFIPDDTFYYLQIARHLAATGHSTFDGTHPTNGYHPAWMAILTGWAAFARSPEGLLRAAVATSLALHLTASVLVIVLLRRFVGRWWAWLGGVVWLWNPLPLLLALQTMEASLSIVCLVGFAILYERLLLRRTRDGRRFDVPRRDVMLVGAALAALTWARTDGFMIGAFALAVAPVLVAARTSLRSGGKAALRMTAAGAVFVIGMAPWMAYSQAIVGTVVQDSAAMKVLSDRHAADVTTASRLLNVHGFLYRVLAHTAAHMGGDTSHMAGDLDGVPPWLLAGAVFAVLAVVRRRTSRARQFFELWAILTAGTIVLFGSYGALISYVQIWYLGPLGFSVFLGGVSSIALLSGRRRLGFLVGIGMLVAAAIVGGRFWRGPVATYPWQRGMFQSLPAFEALIPEQARIGCFNAGIAAFFGHRTVVNLDGLVNHSIHDYWRQRRLDDYFRDEDISYIADETASAEPDLLSRLTPFSRKPPILSVIRQSPLAAPFARRWLYEVGEGAPLRP